jgi:hypothetical protein
MTQIFQWLRRVRLEFPDIEQFSVSHPGPYERQMGDQIARLLRLFQGRVPDPETSARVLRLAATPSRWSAGHALFDRVRGHLLAAGDADRVRCAQYAFEESCLQAMYNATDPPDPFDPGSAFFVAGMAFALARVVGVPEREVFWCSPPSRLAQVKYRRELPLGRTAAPNSFRRVS